MKATLRGMTLIDILVAMILFTVVILGASNLLISLEKLSSNFVKNEASLMGTALGAFEDIVGKITVSNQVSIPATTVTPNPNPATAPYNSIEIRVAPANLPATSIHTNDTIHYYWQDGTQLKYKSKIGPAAASADTVFARDICVNLIHQNHFESDRYGDHRKANGRNHGNIENHCRGAVTECAMSSFRRGFALIAVLAILIVILFGAAAILTSVSGHANIKFRMIQELKAQYLAEAGMQWAIWDCKTTPANCGVDRTSPALDGTTTAFIAKTNLGGGNYRFVVTVNYSDT